MDNSTNFAPRELKIKPYDWQIIEGQVSNEHSEIRVWALDQYDVPYLIRITDFPYFCYLELPTYNSNNTEIIWNSSNSRMVYDILCHKLGTNAPFIYEFVEKTKLVPLQNRITPFLKLYFRNKDNIYSCQNKVGYPIRIKYLGEIKLNLLETNIDIIRRLLTDRRCSYCQWLNIKGRPVSELERVSSVDNEFLVQWKTLQPLDDTDVTHPGILSYDIECYSHNHKAFPNELNAEDDCFMVSCIYQRTGKPQTRKKLVIVYGAYQGQMKETQIIRVGSEEDICFEFAKLIIDWDPEVLIGYNIFNFDDKYLHKRLQNLGLKWPVMGRIRHKPTELYANSWKSSGYGHNNFHILKMDGRINIDVCRYVKRQYKLAKFDLNTVASHFLGEGKEDISPQDMFKAVQGQKIVGEVMQHMQHKEEIESGNGYLAQFENEAEIKQALKQLPTVNTEHLIQQCQAMIDDSTKLMFLVAVYCDRDSEAVIDLFEKLNIWVSLDQMASVSGVTMMDIFTRGQQIRGFSLVSDMADAKGFVINKRPVKRMEWSGGFVWEPQPGYYEYVICLDFKSLYPSIIMALNICWTTLVPPHLDAMVPDDMCNIIEWDEPLNKGDPDEEDADNEIAALLGEKKKARKKKKKGVDEKTEYKHYRFRWLKAEHKKGILPLLEEQLVSARNETRKKMKNITDPLQLLVLDKRQLSLKVTANSMYGMLGAAEKGILPLQEGAMSITAKGRELIKFCNDYLVEKYGARVVYNDSVTGDTPLLIRINGQQQWLNIEDIPHIKDEHQKTHTKLEDYEVWSDRGWTPIKYIICHKTDKKIYRITTNSGTVDVTEDHSLLDAEEKEVRPIEVKIGQSLCHTDLPSFTGKKDTVVHQAYFGHKIRAAKYYHYCVCNGYKLSIDIRCVEGINTYRLSIIENDIEYNTIQKIELLSTTDNYVYDLETSNHHFSAGIGRLVVHNTDSTMIQIPGVKDNKECIMWGKKLEKEISALFPKPLYLEFEKAGPQFCIKKKKYAFWIMNEDGTLPYDKNGDPKFMARGILIARRDNCQWQRRAYDRVLKMIMLKTEYQQVLDYIVRQVVMGLRNNIPWSDLVMIKGLGDSYKDENYCMKVFADQLAKIGKPAQPGDRLEYLVVNSKNITNKELLGKKMRLPQTYLERLETEEQEDLDMVYYVEHMLMNCIEQLWRIGYKDIIEPVMAQNRKHELEKVFAELCKMGYEQQIQDALDKYGADMEQALTYLGKESLIKNKVGKVRCKYISGRNVLETRITDKPIKFLLKGYNMNRLEEVVQGLASAELYAELYK